MSQRNFQLFGSCSCGVSYFISFHLYLFKVIQYSLIKKPMDIEYIHQASLTYSMIDLGRKKISLPGRIDQ